ncbi:MAG: NAD(P)-dependent oxidoreductase [Burkholderiales bacterium]|nr:NAD(P)-dependent oxidoreductase [Burkholderiales bacterium]
MKVGFVGLGRMGSAIAGRVLAAGHDLLVYNRTASKAADLEQAGARVAGSVEAVCEAREVVISMLADDAALEHVAYAPRGLVQSLPRGAVHLAMGTHGVQAVRRLDAAHREAGQFLIAAPVFGRPDAAAAGQLGIAAAGPAEQAHRCEPLFQAIGRRTFDAGTDPVGATAIKLANNFMIGCALESMGEAFSLVRKFGVAPAVLLDVLTNVSFSAPVFKIYGQIMVDESYDQVGFTANLALKDANLILAAADAARVPLACANVVRDRLLSAIAHGGGEKDWAVMAREQARSAGLD